MAVSKLGSVDTRQTFEGDERWELVQRVAHSPILRGSPALQNFLLYVTEHMLSGHAGDIKERSIGSIVLGRKPDYDPASDNIVRVRARQLRQKLEHYFLTEGRAERLIISIPRGGYVPVFVERDAAFQETAGGPKQQQPIEVRGRRATALPWVLAGLLAILCIVLSVRPLLSSGRWVANRSAIDAQRRLWTQIFARKGDQPLVVLGDSSVALWQDLTHNNLSLSNYLAMKYLDDGRGFGDISRRRFTSIADVHLATRIAVLGERLGGSIKMRLARHIDVRDLESGNAVLLGSRRANPWVELFEPHLHYVWEYDDAARRSYFRARAAHNGGAAVLPEAGAQDSYAIVALLPNMSNNGKVLLIEGLSMEGTEAAGEFITNPQSAAVLVRHLTTELGGVDKPFEALLRLTPVAGGPANTRLVGVDRVLP